MKYYIKEVLKQLSLEVEYYIVFFFSGSTLDLKHHNYRYQYSHTIRFVFIFLTDSVMNTLLSIFCSFY